MSNDGIVEFEGEKYITVARAIQEYGARPTLNAWARKGLVRRFYQDDKLHYSLTDLEDRKAQKSAMMPDNAYATERRAQELAKRFKHVSAAKQLEVMTILGMSAGREVG